MTQLTSGSPRTSARGRHRGRVSRTLALIVALALIGAVVGAVIGYSRAQRSTASASVLVAPLDGNPFYPGGRGDDLTNILSEAELVSSDPVVRAVALAEPGQTSLEELREGLSVEVPPNTQIISLEYVATDPTTAVSRAQAFADAYLAHRTERAQELSDSRAERIEQQLAQREDDLRQLLRSRADVQAPTQRGLLDQQIQSIVDQIGVLHNQRGELLTGTLYSGDVVRPAHIEPRTGAAILPLTLLGLIVGALVGSGAALLRARSRSHLQHPEDVEAVDVPLLGSVDWRDARRAADAIRRDGPVGLPMGEDFHALRAALLTVHPGGSGAVLLAGVGERRSSPTVAVGLAASLAAADLDVVLVDATGTGEGLTSDLGLARVKGVTEVLLENLDVAQALQGQGRLRILACGRVTDRIDDLLISERMANLLASLQQRADVVLVASGSMAHSRAQSLAALTGSVLLEVNQGEATLSELSSVTGTAPTTDPRIIGTVFVKHPGKDVASELPGTLRGGEGDPQGDTGAAGPAAPLAGDAGSTPTTGRDVRSGR